MAVTLKGMFVALVANLPGGLAALVIGAVLLLGLLWVFTASRETNFARITLSVRIVVLFVHWELLASGMT